jgi:hypothetical protein
MSERPRTFDWRFLAMLAFLLMVGYLVLTGVVAIQQNAEKGRQIDALISASQQADRSATRQRDALLASQRRLLSRLDSSEAQQRALLEYLRRHGVDIPTRFIEVPVSRQPSGAGVQRPGGGVPGVPATRPPKSLQPPPPSGPGKSGEHRHQPKKR